MAKTSRLFSEICVISAGTLALLIGYGVVKIPIILADAEFHPIGNDIIGTRYSDIYNYNIGRISLNADGSIIGTGAILGYVMIKKYDVDEDPDTWVDRGILARSGSQPDTVISSDGNVILTKTLYGTENKPSIYIWDDSSQTYTLRSTFPVVGNYVFCTALSRDGNTAMYAVNGDGVSLYRRSSGSWSFFKKFDLEGIFNPDICDISSNGNRIGYGGRNHGGSIFYQFVDGSWEKMTHNLSGLKQILISGDGNRVVGLANNPRTLKVYQWDEANALLVNTNSVFPILYNDATYLDGPNSVAVSENGKRIAARSVALSHVKLFEEDEQIPGTWTEIYSETITQSCAKIYEGWDPVDLNSNGTVMAFVFGCSNVRLLKEVTKTIISKYSDLNTSFGYTDAIVSASSNSSFQFNFTNTIPRSTIHAAIVAASACDETNSASIVKDGMNIDNIIGSVVIGTKVASLTKSIEADVDVTVKNNGGPATLQFCLRADLFDDSDSNVSVGAQKVNLNLDIVYETRSGFLIKSIETSEFRASDVSADATRSVGLKIFKNSCYNGCELVPGDSNSCFVANKAAIGDILSLCIKADDADVELMGLEYAKVVAGGYTSNIVTETFAGTAGEDNFVTTTIVENGEVSLKTLLLPAYYDALDGLEGSIEITGTALLMYVSNRRLGGIDDDMRELNAESSASSDEIVYFSIAIPVQKNPVPALSWPEKESSACRTGFGLAALTVACGVVDIF
ncbi:hypothetical protein ACHAXS_003711 [Conticribra weissflogii]